jgi:hypothetical protein
MLNGVENISQPPKIDLVAVGTHSLAIKMHVQHPTEGEQVSTGKLFFRHNECRYTNKKANLFVFQGVGLPPILVVQQAVFAL